MTRFSINMFTEDLSDIYSLDLKSISSVLDLKSISSVEDKESDKIIGMLKNYFFKFSPKDIKTKNDPYYNETSELKVLKEIFKFFMVYEEPKKVVINTCSIKPVKLYVSILKSLQADLKVDVDNSPVILNIHDPLFKNTAYVIINGVSEMYYIGSMLDDASTGAEKAFATWTNPMYLQ